MTIFSYFRVLRKIFGVIALLFFGIFSGFAEEAPRSCTEELVFAVSQVELSYETELEKFLDLRSSQVSEKTKNLKIYFQNYNCQLQYVCKAFENPEISGWGGDFDSCKNINVTEFLEKKDVHFKKSCSAEIQLGGQSNRLELCQNFIAMKLKHAPDFMRKSVFMQSSKENQSFLAAKLADMQKRMKVLYEKTRIFSRNFNKVMNDISCAISDKSA